MAIDIKKIADPGYFRDRELPAHADLVQAPDLAEAEAGVSSFRVSLNGLWKFHYADAPNQVIDGFEAADYDCSNWGEIRVPAHLQMEGYGKPQYANVQYPWDSHENINPGDVPVEHNPVGSYVKYFRVPEFMRGQKVLISFQGVESGFNLWLNGSFVGYSEDSFDASEFDLTPYLVDGVNKLAAQVYQFTSGSWLEDQDMFRFSGIFRDVWLFTVPAVHMYDLKIQTLLDDAYQDAALTLDAKFLCSEAGGSARFILERGGEEVLSEETKISDQTEKAGASCETALDLAPMHLSFEIAKPALWSAEEPNLYNLVIEVKNASGDPVEYICQKVGFRRFEMKDGIMTINGRRIVFKGVNRHEFSALHGRVPDEDEIRQDIITMKQNNINAIRTSHYPDDTLLYDLCDEYGLYMIAENNMESHGAWNPIMMKKANIDAAVPGDRPEWEPLLMDRLNSMYQAKKNHPAIIIWSCGNESYGGSVICHMSEKFRELDPTRLVHYEGIANDGRYPDTSDMISRMYPTVEQIAQNLAEQSEKPFLVCEYTHAMGNSCGAMYKYTDLTETEPRFQGGFIWDYIDQAITARDRYGNPYQAYGGDFGETPTDYDFSGDGICVSGGRKPSPKMPSVKFNYRPIRVTFGAMKENGTFAVTIRNANLFLATDAYDCHLIADVDGERIGDIVLPAEMVLTPADSTKEFTLEIPENWMWSEGELVLTLSFVLKEDTLWADAGYEIAFGQGVYHPAGPSAWTPAGVIGETDGVDTALPMKVTWGREGSYIGVKGEHFEAVFSERKGGLAEYRYGGADLFDKVPAPNFWRPATANDNGNMMPFRYAQWKIASLFATPAMPYIVGDHCWAFGGPAAVEAWDADGAAIAVPDGTPGSLPARITAETVRVTFTLNLPTQPASSCQTAYTVHPDGTIDVKLSGDFPEELGDMPEFGMVLRMSADYDQLSWYGLGDAETYKDRTQGAKLGLFGNEVADNFAAYLVPQECGNHMGVRWAAVTDQKGRGLLITTDSAGTLDPTDLISGGMNVSALPWSVHEIDAAEHSYDLPEVHHTWIRVAADQMGVGGDDSWGSMVDDEALVPGGRKEFTFSFRGI